MRIIFMGTPDFSVGTLKTLKSAGHDIVLAVTQPDRPKGRGRAVPFTPVKEAALELGIEVFQPRRVRESECIEYLRGYKADIIVVAAFGQILPPEILDMPRYGCVNVHASLLPKYRGASPIQWAVINGEEVSGVTIMKMDEGLDTGDIIMQRKVALDPKETAGSLFDKLSKEGAKLCAEAITAIEDGTAVYTKQNELEATKTGQIKKELGNIDWTRPAAQIERLIRGLTPWPGTYTALDGKVLKIWDGDICESALKKDSASADASAGAGVVPGTVLSAGKEGLMVQTGDEILNIKELQLSGKKRMQADAFLRGYKVEAGTILGEY